MDRMDLDKVHEVAVVKCEECQVIYRITTDDECPNCATRHGSIGS